MELHTDGLFALGNCKTTLVHQWSKLKLISQNVVGVCIVPELQLEFQGTRPHAGYISVGIDFKDDMDKSNSAWVKLIKSRNRCAFVILYHNFLN